MKIETAQDAAALLPQILGLQAVIAAVEQALTNKAAFLGSVGINDPVLGTSSPSLPPMTMDESAPILKQVLEVYQARLAVVQTQLDAL